MVGQQPPVYSQQATASKKGFDCVQDVIVSNLQLLRETHLMDRDYFRLILTLVKGSSEICNHKIRRTGGLSCVSECDPSYRTIAL